MSKNKKINSRPVIENRQARFNFELSEDFEAGISLNGWEVKGIRASQADMKDSYVLMKKGKPANPTKLYHIFQKERYIVSRPVWKNFHWISRKV